MAKRGKSSVGNKTMSGNGVLREVLAGSYIYPVRF